MSSGRKPPINRPSPPPAKPASPLGLPPSDPLGVRPSPPPTAIRPPASPSSANSNKTLLIVIGSIVGVPVLLMFSCCMCGPIVSLFVTTDLERADALWSEGNKADAVQLYVAEINNGLSRRNPTVLNRVITYFVEVGDREQAKLYCEKALDADVALMFDVKEPRDLYTSVKTERQREAAEKQAADLAAKAEAERATQLDKDASMAWQIAKDKVKDHLKTPSTASFGGLFDQNYKQCVRVLPDGDFRVQGWVDSQNDFGAMKRSQFSLKLRKTEDGKWGLVDGPLFITR